MFHPLPFFVLFMIAISWFHSSPVPSDFNNKLFVNSMGWNFLVSWNEMMMIILFSWKYFLLWMYISLVLMRKYKNTMHLLYFGIFDIFLPNCFIILGFNFVYMVHSILSPYYWSFYKIFCRFHFELYYISSLLSVRGMHIMVHQCRSEGNCRSWLSLSTT